MPLLISVNTIWEAIGLQDVAQCCNVSPEYLSKFLKKKQV